MTESPGYALRLPPEAVDVARFEALVREGQTLLAAGRPASACHVLELGLGLWRGSAYQDLAFESFLQPEIARLGQLRATAGETRAEALLAVGRADEAVVDVSAMIDEDPLRERRWGLLALSLYRTGRQGEALRALDEARRALGEELGLELGPDLRRLEQDILNQAPALEWRESVPKTSARRVPLRYANEAISEFATALATAVREPGEGSVLAPDACPHGFSLTAMANAVALFTVSGNDPDLYPDTPFQILYVEDMDVEVATEGTQFKGENSFRAAEGTHFFVPIFGANDKPPVFAPFPTTPAEAAPYLADPEHWGGSFTVDVDGTITAIGPEYVAGPIPLPGEEGFQWTTFAIFLGPLSPGTHTVTIRGSVSGRGVMVNFGVASFRQTLAYTIDVAAGHRSSPREG